MHSPYFSTYRMHAQQHPKRQFEKELQTKEPEITKKIKNYNFKLNDVIGKGSFSTVYRGYEESTEELVAIKVVEVNKIQSPAILKLLYSEVDILKSVRHPNILKCLDVYFSSSNCYIVTEYCGDGDIKSLISKEGTLEEITSKKLILGIYEGLRYLAKQGIVHRDLKAANVFIKDGQPKIADFGFSKRTTQTFRDINIGSPLCMSPEGLIDNVYGPKTDVWAFGILLYEMFHGRTPFGYCKNQQQLKQVVSKPLRQDALSQKLSVNLRQLIMDCLQVNSQYRISIQEIEHSQYIKNIRQSMQTGNLIVSQVEQYHINVYDQSKVSTQAPIKTERTRNQDNRIDLFGSNLDIQPKNDRNNLYPKNYNLDIKPKQNNINLHSKVYSPSRKLSYGQIHFKSQIRTNREDKGDTSLDFHNRKLTFMPDNKDSKKLNSTISNMRTKEQTHSPFKTQTIQNCLIKNLTNFQDFLSYLHYCRILFKTIKVCENHTFRKLDILGSWLFRILEELILNIQKVTRPHLKILQLKDIIFQYNNKYQNELPFVSKLNPNLLLIQSTIAEIMSQLQCLKGDKACLAISHLVFLYDITQLLQKACKMNDHEYFTQHNGIQCFISLKQKSKMLQSTK